MKEKGWLQSKHPLREAKGARRALLFSSTWSRNQSDFLSREESKELARGVTRWRRQLHERTAVVLSPWKILGVQELQGLDALNRVGHSVLLPWCEAGGLGIPWPLDNLRGAEIHWFCHQRRAPTRNAKQTPQCSAAFGNKRAHQLTPC